MNKPETPEELDVMVEERRALDAIGQVALEQIESLPEENAVRKELEQIAKLAEDRPRPCTVDHERAASIANALKANAVDMSFDGPYRDLALRSASRWARLAEIGPDGLSDNRGEKAVA